MNYTMNLSKKILLIGIMVLLALFLLGMHHSHAAVYNIGENENGYLNGNRMYPCIYNNNGVQSYLDLSSLIWTKDITCPDGSVDHVINCNIITMDDNKPIYHPVQLRINDNKNRVFRIFGFQPSEEYLLIKKSAFDPQYNAGSIMVNLLDSKELLKS